MWNYKLGAVVRTYDGIKYGHITGFDNLGKGTLVRVRWETGDETSVEPHKISLRDER
jgi:hypothetical protein